MGITDGTFVCGLCGEWTTGCALCNHGAPLVDRRSEIAAASQRDREAEREEREIEHSIRRAAATRSTLKQEDAT